MNISIKKQNGFSAIMALVLIVLFALVGAYMATLSSVSAISTAMSGSAIQAWFAARSGVEWAVFNALSVNSCGTIPAPPMLPPPELTLSEGGATGFNVNLTCTFASVTEGPDVYNVYSLSSSATRGTSGEVGYASRTISVSVTDAP